MHQWFSAYKRLSERTRWFGVVLGVFLWVALLLELADLAKGLARSGGLLRWLTFENLEYFLLIPAIILVTIRVFGLLILNERPSNLARYSWLSLLLLFLFVSVYIYVKNLNYGMPENNCVPDGKNVCFGVYDLRLGPVWPLSLFVYLLIGAIGIMFKTIYSYTTVIKVRSSSPSV